MLPNIDELRRHVVQVQRQLVAQRQRQMQQERASQLAFEKLCLSVIDVLDLIDELNHTTKPGEATENLHKVQRRLATMLKRQGIEQLRLEGAMPEAGKCKVVGTQSMPGKKPGEVVEVLRKGYYLGDRVLRPIEVMTQATTTCD